MTPLFAYTSEAWPYVLTGIVAAALAVYVRPRRHVPGGGAFLVGLLLLAVAGSIQSLLVLASSLDLKILLRGLWAAALLIAFVSLVWQCFRYAGLANHYPRDVILLSFPPLVLAACAVTNPLHHLVWRSLWYDGHLHGAMGPLGYLMLIYVYVLMLIATTVMSLVSARSRGLLRRQAIMITAGLSIVVLGYTLEVALNNRAFGLPEVQPALPAGLIILGLALLTFAVFRLHAFDLAPVARHLVVENLHDGMLVVDAKGRVVDMNPAAARFLGLDHSRLIGEDVQAVLGKYPGVMAAVMATRGGQARASLNQPSGRIFDVEVSPVAGPNEQPGGQLIVCRDVTERRRAEATVERQQLALATLAERERLARELHDGLAQVIAYARIQLQATSEALDRNSAGQSRAELARIASVLQDAHEDVRDFLLGIKSGRDTAGLPAQRDGSAPAGEASSLAASVAGFVARFSARHSFRVDVAWHPGSEDLEVDPGAEVQLMRILQESLVNCQRHAATPVAVVAFERGAGFLQMTVKDEGCGFEPDRLFPDQGSDGGSGHYGLHFMRERAEAVGGSFEVVSRPGRGTEVQVRVPLASASAGPARLFAPSAEADVCGDDWPRAAARILRFRLRAPKGERLEHA